MDLYVSLHIGKCDPISVTHKGFNFFHHQITANSRRHLYHYSQPHRHETPTVIVLDKIRRSEDRETLFGHVVTQRMDGNNSRLQDKTVKPKCTCSLNRILEHWYMVIVGGKVFTVD